jgi:hypothetical protein
MAEQKLVSVFVGTGIKARYIEALLGQAEIPCLLKNELSEAAHSGYGGPGTDDAFELFVNEVDVEKAKAIISES